MGVYKSKKLNSLPKCLNPKCDNRVNQRCNKFCCRECISSKKKINVCPICEAEVGSKSLYCNSCWKKGYSSCLKEISFFELQSKLAQGYKYCRTHKAFYLTKICPKCELLNNYNIFKYKCTTCGVSVRKKCRRCKTCLDKHFKELSEKQNG